MDVAIVIPARMGSTRFPGKPLVDLLGKPMFQHVVERAKESGISSRVVVATPDQEIIEACRQWGTEYFLTRDDHPSGTDRIAEVSELLGADIYVNVQGDEPLIDPASIRACAAPLLEDASVEMGSLYCACSEAEENEPSAVKVVVDLRGDALYFSRFPLPFPRNPRTQPLKKHVGIYAFRKAVLQQFAGWPVTPLEAAESLEQLRFLEHGVKIRMSEGQASLVAVDTEPQAEEVRRIMQSRRDALGAGHAS